MKKEEKIRYTLITKNLLREVKKKRKELRQNGYKIKKWYVKNGELEFEVEKI